MNRMKKKDRESLIDLMGGKKNAIAILIALIIGLSGEAAWYWAEEKKAEESRYITSWPITMNQNIEWTWAGKPE